MNQSLQFLVATVLKAKVACVQFETGGSCPHMATWIVHLLPFSFLSNAKLQLHLAGRVLRSTRRIGEGWLRVTPPVHSYANQTPVKVGVVQRTIQMGNEGDVDLLPEQSVPVAGREERVGLDALSRTHPGHSPSHSRFV